MAHEKKKKSLYKKGGVVGTSGYSEHGYERGGVVGTAEYSKRKYKKGGIAKPKYKDGGIVKRKGWGDKEGSRLSYKVPAAISYDGKAYGKRKGYGDKEGSRHSYKNVGGNAGNKEKYAKRKGWNDHGVEHAYEDGGIVKRQAKLDALQNLHDQMSEMSSGSLNEFKDGGVVPSNVVAKEEVEIENSNEEESDGYEGLSREDLLKLLRNS